MKLEIDTEQLEAERSAIQSRLQVIDTILSLAKNGIATLALAPKIPQPVAPELPQPAPKRVVRADVRTGMKRAILTSLLTGRSNSDDLARALGWTLHDIRRTVHPLRKQKILFLTETGHWDLSPEGRKQADWFAIHPEYVTYSPK